MPVGTYNSASYHGVYDQKPGAAGFGLFLGADESGLLEITQ